MGKGHVKQEKKKYTEGYNYYLNSQSPKHGQFGRPLLVTYKQSLNLKGSRTSPI